MGDTSENEDVDNPVPETHVLAIASHVVYGYVGNTMATFCMQTLGCDVAAINTVNFSNHTGYRQFTGPRTPAETIASLYKGLTQSNLLDFDVLLSGYIPSPAGLHEVATIARDLKLRRETMNPGSFFWILDPVMGDQGRLYVSEEMVSWYKKTIRSGMEGPDLVVPNRFELELISDVCLSTDEDDQDQDKNGNGAKLERRLTGDDYEANLTQVKEAISVLHRRDGVRMVVVTSIRVKDSPGTLYVIGSECRSDGSSRCFAVRVPALDCHFNGTGDMFAGLMVARLREACHAAGTLHTRGWASPDDVPAVGLPLARATVAVLSSMSAVLEKTVRARDAEMALFEARRRGGVDATGDGADQDGNLNDNYNDDDDDDDDDDEEEQATFLARTKAAEVRAVRNASDLLYPKLRYEATEL